MDRPHFRPRLALLVPRPLDEVRELLRARLELRTQEFEFRVRHDAVLAWIAPRHRRFWSPALDTSMRQHPDGTLLIGCFGPHPALMTGYFFASIFLTFLATLSATWSYVQTTMGLSPHCLWGTSLAILGLVGIWLSSRVGASWGRTQMVELASLLDDLGELRDDEAELLTEAEAHRQEALLAERSGGASEQAI
jgi:hypothetical protein